MTSPPYVLFSDEVYSATDLNRKAGEVLNHARRGPVTISRNNEQFALLRREEVAKLLKTNQALRTASSLIKVILSVSQHLPVGVEYERLTKFGPDDLQSLCVEVINAVEVEDTDAATMQLSETIHGWRETASLIGVAAFEEALSADREPVELQIPEPENL